MIAFELPTRRVDETLRVLRALGKHRYVAGRAHWVHALAAAGEDGELGQWARDVLADSHIDKASRDERLVRRATEEEVCTLLAHHWGATDFARELGERLRALGLSDTREPFSSEEDEIFPLLVDVGWELLPLAELDQERHRGAIEAFEDFETARFEETEYLPRVTHLQEVDAMGFAELVRGAIGEELLQPLTIWLGGSETYQDYVMRGAMRAAKL